MEYIDIIDEKGNKTGEVKTKEEIHKKGLWHKTVHVWIINHNNEILIQKRSKEKKNFPDMWDISAAWHISAGEESKQSAIREVKEEVGMDIGCDDLNFLGSVEQRFILNNGTYLDNEINDVYLVKVNQQAIDNIKMQKEEVEELKWITYQELQDWVENKKVDLVPHEEYSLLFNKLKL